MRVVRERCGKEATKKCMFERVLEIRDSGAVRGNNECAYATVKKKIPTVEPLRPYYLQPVTLIHCLFFSLLLP